MQIQRSSDLATSLHPCECDGVKVPINNFQTHEERCYWGVVKGDILPNQPDSFCDETVLVHEKGRVNIVIDIVSLD